MPDRPFTPVRVDARHDLREQAGRHLRKALGRRADRLTVVARDGSVYLAGRVRSYAERQAAQEAVRGLAEGGRVYSDLLVA